MLLQRPVLFLLSFWHIWPSREMHPSTLDKRSAAFGLRAADFWNEHLLTSKPENTRRREGSHRLLDGCLKTQSNRKKLKTAWIWSHIIIKCLFMCFEMAFVKTDLRWSMTFCCFRRQSAEPESNWVEDLMWFHQARVRDVEWITGLDFYQDSNIELSDVLRMKTRPTSAIKRTEWKKKRLSTTVKVLKCLVCCLSLFHQSVNAGLNASIIQLFIYLLQNFTLLILFMYS